jgi:hypothetical protein
VHHLKEFVMTTTTLNLHTAPAGNSIFASVAQAVRGFFAARRQATIDAQEVRELAYSMLDTQPGVASDLLAAVDRYEARQGL